jgi:hypothetical protein
LTDCESGKIGKITLGSYEKDNTTGVTSGAGITFFSEAPVFIHDL